MPLDRRICMRRGEPRLSKFSAVSQIGLAWKPSGTTKIVSGDGAAVILVFCLDQWLT
jgi:hypothetical protein